MMIAPISLVLAAAHTLNKLSSDSEIIVMNAAGVSPWRMVRPLLAAAFVVSLLVCYIAVYLSPWSLRELRDWATQVRTDILTNIVQPGRFTTVGGNLTFHIADRRPNGFLVGIFLDDQRDPHEHATYLAEQGEIVKNDTGTFLVLEKGSVQRLEAGQRDPRIVTFDRYAFDLSKFTAGPQNVTYNTHEKYIWELWPLLDDPHFAAQAGEYRAELHDRFATPLYPFAFVILAYAFLGPPQTTRQSRTLSLLGLVGAVAALRLIGFLSIIVGTKVPTVLGVQYAALLAAVVAGSWQISRGQAIEPAAIVARIASALSERFAKVTAS
jgi:lipopolysaccharide export system permease protein